jgi:hypothetical protein
VVLSREYFCGGAFLEVPCDIYFFHFYLFRVIKFSHQVHTLVCLQLQSTDLLACGMMISRQYISKKRADPPFFPTTLKCRNNSMTTVPLIDSRVRFHQGTAWGLYRKGDTGPRDSGLRFEMDHRSLLFELPFVLY